MNGQKLPPLPPGFELEPVGGSQSASAGIPPLPPGFELEAPQPASVASSAVSSQVQSAADAGILGAVDGATFGFLDEAASGIDWALDKLPGREGRTYDEILAANRGEMKGAQEAHPYAYTGGQVVGAVGSGLVGAAAAPATASRALGLGAQTVRGQLTAAAASGAALGAVDGFGRGEGGLENRFEGAAYGAGVGGGLGFASVPAGRLIGAGVNAVAERFATSGGPLGRASQNLLDRTLADEGLTLEQAAQRAREMGPSAMLADTSEGLRYRAEQIAQSDTPGRPTVINALRDRSSTAGDRIGSAYDAALGPRPNVQQTLAAMTKQLKDSADLLYGQARTENAPVDVAPVISAIDGQLLTPAERIAGPSGLPADEVDTALAWVRSHLTDGSSQRTGIDRLDRLERRLRARTTAAFKGGKSDVGNALNEVGRTLREQMKASSPVYAQARATFSDDSAVQDAFTSGRKLFGSGTHPDFLAAEVADMSEAERDALRLGVRAAVDESMGRVRNGSLKGRQLLDSDFNERKILTVLGEDEGRALINALQGEQAMAETANQAMAGSATARRQDNPFQVQQRTQQDRAVPGIIRSAGNFNFGDAAFRGVEYAQDALGRRSAATMSQELGPALTTTGEARDELLEALIAAQRRQGASRSRDPGRQALVDALTRGGALALAPHVGR